MGNLKERIKEVLINLILGAFKILPDKYLIPLISRLSITRQMDYTRHSIYIRINSLAEYKLRLRSCQKEPWTVEWIEKFIKPGEVMYDIGANVGAYSLIAAKATNGKAKIFAFEPAFSNYSALCHNVILNNCQESIIPLPIALSSKTKMAQFNYSDITSGKALHRIGESVYYTGEHFKPAYKQSILSYRLDDLIEEFNLPTPNHMKIDVDGTELDVLLGAEKITASSKLSTALLEIIEDNKGEYEEVIKLFNSKGFNLHSKNTPTKKDGTKQPFSYYLFVRKRNE